MKQSTTNYSLFKLRPDNREKIDQSHIRKLVASIKQKNLLESRPIMVNEEMEVIDGQHRLKAAEILNIPVWYEVNKNLQSHDIINLNVSKSWQLPDYMNYWCKQHYPEYLKLEKFIKENYLNLSVALLIVLGRNKKNIETFKNGEFVFSLDVYKPEIDLCWETIGYIKNVTGPNKWSSSSRFWQAMLRLFQHPDFIAEKWRHNMKVKVENFYAKPSIKDFILMICSIYNWNNPKKIHLIEDNKIVE